MTGEVEFVTADVFTDRRFGGNPLAVVPRADGLDGYQMQTIATEFNLSGRSAERDLAKLLVR